METAGKLIAAALLCCILCLLLQKQAPELTLALCALGCVLCLLLTLPFFSQTFTSISRASRASLHRSVTDGVRSVIRHFARCMFSHSSHLFLSPPRGKTALRPF